MVHGGGKKRTTGVASARRQGADMVGTTQPLQVRTEVEPSVDLLYRRGLQKAIAIPRQRRTRHYNLTTVPVTDTRGWGVAREQRRWEALFSHCYCHAAPRGRAAGLQEGEACSTREVPTENHSNGPTGSRRP